MVRTSFMAQSQRSHSGALEVCAQGAILFMLPACPSSKLARLIQVKTEHQGDYVGARAEG